MHQTKKGNQWHFSIKVHIGVDVESGLAHSVMGTVANVNDVPQAASLLHGEERDAWNDAGYQGVDKREEFKSYKTRSSVAIIADSGTANRLVSFGRSSLKTGILHHDARVPKYCQNTPAG